MKINSFIKTLNHAKKDYPEIDKYINQYESGLITFQDCLLMISTEYNSKKAIAAIENIYERLS